MATAGGTVILGFAEDGVIADGIPMIGFSHWQWPHDCGPLARQLIDLGASILGMKRQPGARVAMGFVNRLAGVVICRMFLKPSVDSVKKLDCAPPAFARAVPELASAGSRLLGGCCGTTEEHIAALAGALRFDARRAGRSVFFSRSVS